MFSVQFLKKALNIANFLIRKKKSLYYDKHRPLFVFPKMVIIALKVIETEILIFIFLDAL